MHRVFPSSIYSVLANSGATARPSNGSYRALNLAATLLVALAVGTACSPASAQTDEWTWMGGQDSAGEWWGQYGTLGTPAASNFPGSRQFAAGWTDKSGNLWLFGGWGFGVSTSNVEGEMNDLWQFNPATNEWTWMGGSNSAATASGVYGTIQTPAAGNIPSGRFGAVRWTDSNGNFWLFGGYGFDSVAGAPGFFGPSGYLNDLWEFNPSKNQWTWVAGSSVVPASCASLSLGGIDNGFAGFPNENIPGGCGQSGVYGTLGTPATTNVPGARYNAVSWTDAKGNLWLFGGLGFDASGNLGILNDLWEFQPASDEWTWVSGSSTNQFNAKGRPGVYGTLQNPEAGNTPGGRMAAESWTDSKGNLWLFGGYGADTTGTMGYLNDLWEFSVSANEWTWMGGNSTLGWLGGQPGVYESWMTPSNGNSPGGRLSATTWTDNSGNLWLLGGYGYDSEGFYAYLNDLWEFNPSTNEWTWMDGDATITDSSLGHLASDAGVYGNLQTPGFLNTPGGRDGATGWTDGTGNLWLFAGNAYEGFNSYAQEGYLDDFWEYSPGAGSQSASATPSISPGSGTYPAGESLILSDSTPGSTIYYFTPGSSSATQYTTPLTISSTESIQAVAAAPSYATSAVASATYTVPQAAAPTFSLPPGTYTASLPSGTNPTQLSLVLSDATPGAVIYWTGDGSTPTTSSTEYTAPIELFPNVALTIQAIAVASGYAESPVAGGFYAVWPASVSPLNEWAWMMGPGNGSWSQVYGTLGVPAVGNIPSARTLASTWTDKSGNFWLFGGGSYDGELNDLWELTASTREWAWMGGSVSTNCDFGADCDETPAGLYGTLGTSAPGNIPGGRQDAASWIDNSGNLWVFGGYGSDAIGSPGLTILNDLWKYDIATSQWTWMSGSSTVGNSCFNDGAGETATSRIVCALPAVYGNLGTFAPGNTPGSRAGAIHWTDSKGNLWMFGGWSFDVPNQDLYVFDELWEYNTTTNQWAWMGGSSTRNGSACYFDGDLFYFAICGEAGNYGTVGTPAAGNLPGGRSNSATWVDRSGNVWLFSGFGFDSNGNVGDLQDLWEFNPSTSQWTWMGGNSALFLCDAPTSACSGPAVYGTLGTPAAGDFPVGREQASTWTDSNGNFWLFGGGGFYWPEPEDIVVDAGSDDLWEFNSSADEWTWMGNEGYSSSDPVAVFGTPGIPAPSNGPGGVSGTSNWVDSGGHFWLMAFQEANNLWEYIPSAPAPVPSFAVVDWNYQGFNNAQSFVVAAGTSGTTTVNTVVADGFDQPVTLSAVNLPTGITATFSPATITGFGVSQVTFAVALNVTPGDYTFTIAGTSGSVTESKTLTLEVASAPPPSFSLSASPPSLMVNSGSQGSVSLTVTPEYGFSSAVSFACSGLPANATCSFSPTTVTPSGATATTQLTIAVSAQASVVKPGSRPLLPAAGLVIAACFFLWKRRRILDGTLAVVLILFSAALLSGCGGGGAAGSGGGTGGGGSPQSYTVTVTATSATILQTTTLALTEN
jgi:N-acetylneuraminic acid mutarotase